MFQFTSQIHYRITLFIITITNTNGYYQSRAYFVTKLGQLNPDTVPAYIKGALSNDSVIYESSILSDYGLYSTYLNHKNKELTIIGISKQLDLISQLADEMWIEPPDKIQDIIDFGLKFNQLSGEQITIAIKPITIETLTDKSNIGPFSQVGNITTHKKSSENNNVLYYFITNFLLVIITYILLVFWHNSRKLFDLKVWFN